MALTLEAALVVPITMAITMGTLYSSVCLYERTAADAKAESASLCYTVHNVKSWSCMVRENTAGCRSGEENVWMHVNGQLTWSKMISVNPVRIKNILSVVYDTIGEIREFFPAYQEMEGLYLEDAEQ